MSLTPENALDRLDSVIVAAKRAGASAADAVMIEDSSESVSWRMGALEDVSRSEGIDLGLRVFFGQQVATVSSSDHSAKALAALVERAVSMAKLAPEDKYALIAAENMISHAPFPALDLAAADLPGTETLRTLAATAEDAARAVPGVSNSEGAGAGTGKGMMALATSNGFRGAYASTSVSVSASVLAEKNGDMVRDYYWHSARHFSDLEKADAVGREAGERTVRRVGAMKPEGGTLPVVFDPRVSGSLVGHFLSAINGQSIARQSSFLMGKMGTQIFAPGISIVDDPLLVRGLRSRPFDAEGLAARRFTLVENGVLQTWLLDLASAAQLNLTPTGHAVRGISSPPSPGSSNTHMLPGTLSPQDLIKDISRGIYVTEMIGSGVNGLTGDYSRGAAGFLIENGTLTVPVHEITIAGTLQDMFLHLVPANDLELRYGVNAPTLRIDGLRIAGSGAAEASGS